MKDVYVLVVHKSGRGFGLDRSYRLIKSDVDNARLWLKARLRVNEVEVLDEWSGWLPTSESQRPAWIEGLPDSEFHAYWLKSNWAYIHIDHAIDILINGPSTKPRWKQTLLFAR